VGSFGRECHDVWIFLIGHQEGLEGSAGEIFLGLLPLTDCLSGDGSSGARWIYLLNSIPLRGYLLHSGRGARFSLGSNFNNGGGSTEWPKW